MVTDIMLQSLESCKDRTSTIILAFESWYSMPPSLYTIRSKRKWMGAYKSSYHNVFDHVDPRASESDPVASWYLSHARVIVGDVMICHIRWKWIQKNFVITSGCIKPPKLSLLLPVGHVSIRGQLTPGFGPLGADLSGLVKADHFGPNHDCLFDLSAACLEKWEIKINALSINYE
jgi:hypothetical protein